MSNLEKLNKIAIQDNTWIKQAKQRQKNRGWLKHSQKIAIKVLRTLREKNIRQKQLAEMLGVSPQQVNKIVKGKENLTLETISKIEEALNVSLIFKEKTNHIIKRETVLEKKTIVWPVYTKTSMVSEKRIDYKSQKTEVIIQDEPQLFENYG